MCYTEEVSLIAFVVNVIGSIILYFENRILGLFLLYVGLMQLYEFIFWRNPKENMLNLLTTKIAMLSNLLQPIVLCLIIYLVLGKLKMFTFILLIIYSFFILFYIIKYWASTNYTVVREKTFPSLSWDWIETKESGIMIYLFILLTSVAFLQHLPFPINIIMILLSVTTLFISSYFPKGKSGLGRIWCYMTAYEPLLFVVLFKILKYSTYKKIKIKNKK